MNSIWLLEHRERENGKWSEWKPFSVLGCNPTAKPIKKINYERRPAEYVRKVDPDATEAA
jgi:hypothetical protein